MRVIIWGINYAPEPTGISPYTSELAEFLETRDGLDVEVVTGFQYYPQWKKEPQDQGKLYRMDIVNNVKVHRCWQYVPHRLSTIKRMLHEMTFGVTSLIRTLFLRRADVYVVISPPLGLGMCAWLVTRLKRSRFLFHVQDLQPDSAAGLGMMKKGLVLRAMYALENFSYSAAAGVSGVSPGMVDAFAAKGVPEEKRFLLPNWLRPRVSPTAAPGEPARFRRDHNIPENALLAVYSGNLGRKQGLEVMLDAAEVLEGADLPRPVVIVIAGDGGGKEKLEERLRARPLANVRLLPLQPTAEYHVMLKAADLALVTQMPGTGQVCFPSKLLSVLSAGLPVITAADDNSDLARAVRDGGFGVNVPALAGAQLAGALRRAATVPAVLQAWTDRTGWVHRFSPDAMLPKMELAIHAVATDQPQTSEGLARAPGRLN